MAFEKLTWAGFVIVAAGWTLLFSTPHLDPSGGMRLDYAAVAQSVIMCGLGLAVIGAMQTGFGALNRFFDAVAARSRPAQPLAGGAVSGDLPVGRTQPAAATSPRPRQQPQIKASANAARTGVARKILERGWVKDRAYVQFTDGSVEVETLLGRRSFPSLKDAREFIA